MKLYYSKGSCSLAVRIVIHEIGLKCDFEAVSLSSKKTENNIDFLSISPKGAVPTLLLDNGEILTENIVIQQYLADQFDAVHLLPPMNHFLRYRILEWLNFITTDIHKGCAPLFNPNIPQIIKDEIFKANLTKKLDYIDQHLQTNTYLAADQFSLPDGYLFVILGWFPRLKLELSDWLHLERYYHLIRSREAVERALKEEGLIP